MYGSSYGHSLRPEQFRGLSQQDVTNKLITFTEQWKYMDEWRCVIAFILKHEEEPRQFDTLHVLLNHMLNLNRETLFMALSNLYDGLSQIKTVGTLFMLMWFTYLDTRSSDGYYFRREYMRFVDKHELYPTEIMNLEDVEVKDYPPRLIEQVRFCVETLPTFVSRNREKLSLASIDELLNWALIYPVQTREQATHLSQFCKTLANACTETDYYTGEFNRDISSAFIMYILRKCGFNFPGCDNLALAIDHLPEIAINNIDECKDLRCLPNDVLISAFVKLTRSCLTSKVLKLLQCLSFILMRESDFFTLKRLYKEVILPKFIRFGKGSTTCQKELQKIARFYVQGFIGLVPITQEELEHFFYGYNLVKRSDMEFWIRLACLCTFSDKNLQLKLQRHTSSIITNDPLTILSEKELYNAMQNVWEIDRKDMEERKRYSLSDSKKSGIVNSSSRCYIISVLQALYSTKSFPDLLKRYDSEYRTSYTGYGIRCPLLYELQWLMVDLKDHRRMITPDRVKHNGPEYFRDTQGQQDCQEYLSALFEYIEKELNAIDPKVKADFLARFKEIFEITIRTTIVCERCRNTNHNDENSYIHALDLQQPLKVEWVQHVNHTCDKCGAVNPNREMRKKITKFPETLLVTIKRFSFRDDRQIKELGSCHVARKFAQYQLTGFISHIGRNPLCGHYVYYCRKEGDPLTWLEFNDQRVGEFTLETPEQEFQENFASANTPYVLIYQTRK